MQILKAPGKWYDGITDREMEFLKIYAENGRNGTDAVVRAEAYTVNRDAAGVMAVEILRRPRVQVARDRLLVEKFGVVKMSAERLIDEITQMSTFDPKDLFDSKGRILKNINEIPEKARKAILSMDVVTVQNDDEDDQKVMYIHKIKFDSKKAYQKMLGETMTLFTEKKIIEQDISLKADGRDVNERINVLLGLPEDTPPPEAPKEDFDPLDGLA